MYIVFSIECCFTMIGFTQGTWMLAKASGEFLTRNVTLLVRETLGCVGVSPAQWGRPFNTVYVLGNKSEMRNLVMDEMDKDERAEIRECSPRSNPRLTLPDPFEQERPLFNLRKPFCGTWNTRAGPDRAIKHDKRSFFCGHFFPPNEIGISWRMTNVSLAGISFIRVRKKGGGGGRQGSQHKG